MFGFNLSLNVYIPGILIMLSIVGGLLFFEYKLCDANDPKRFKAVALKVWRLFFKIFIRLIALIIISWLIFSIIGTPRAISDIDWSFSDSLFMLLIVTTGGMVARFEGAGVDFAVEWAKKKRSESAKKK